jgi:chromosome segregation ATPase
MAFTSPFPTSHDTIGTSTLGSPALMPISPPQLLRTRRNPSIDDDEKPITHGPLRDADGEGPPKQTVPAEASRTLSPVLERNRIDKRLAEYTIDWSKLPGGGRGKDPVLDAPEEDDDKDSEIGGPEDFTMNIEKYILGDGTTKDRRREDLVEKREQQRLDSRSPPAQRNTEEGDYSEFGPPVDMSTPSHLLWRMNLSTGKEATHLEDIEEHLADSPDRPRTPSKPTEEEQHPEDDTYATVLREIEHLQEELRDRDEKIRANRKRVLEAASAAEEIRHLRAELQRQDALLSDMNAKSGEEEALLRDEIQKLRKENAEKERLLQESNDRLSKMEAVEQQVHDLKAELRKRDGLESDNEESAKTIASLRQQLSEAQEQLKKRDEALEDSASKLRRMTADTELQLRQKNTEIEDLKAQIDDRQLEVCQMEERLAEANGEFEVLEERIGSLENRNRPLEEKNIVLEAEVNQVKRELNAQKNALSIMAATFSIETDGKSYNEILDSLKARCQSNRTSDTPSQESSTTEKETNELRRRMAKLEAESKESASAKESLELELKRSQELLTESRALIRAVEIESTRLTSQLHEVNSNLAKTREELSRVKDERSSALETIERLRRNTDVRPPSPTTAQESTEQKYRAIQEAHQLEIKSLQDAHASAISTIRKSYTGTTDNLRALLAESEKREADLRSELRALRTSSSSSSSHERGTASLRAEMKRLESVLAIKEEAAADVDRRIARSVEKREREWERRIDLLLKERDKMSKALMWAWGEKEVGGGGGRRKETTASGGGDDDARAKQGYRYKYVLRSAT